MLSFDSYREVLSEHARDHHLVKSAWIVVLILGALLVMAYEVRGTLRRLEQLVDGSSGAVISLELSVLEKREDKLLLSKVYTCLI